MNIYRKSIIVQGDNNVILLQSGPLNNFSLQKYNKQ